MDYYQNKKVSSWNKIGDGIYDGMASGNNGNSYSVHIDKLHPRKGHQSSLTLLSRKQKILATILLSSYNILAAERTEIKSQVNL